MKHFRADEIIISTEEARRVLKFYFTDPVPDQLTPQDVAFAQALLLEGIDMSYAMGYVHFIFDSFYMKVPTSFDSINDMVTGFGKKAARHWFQHALGKDRENPQIYNCIRLQIRSNWGSVWGVRTRGLDLEY